MSVDELFLTPKKMGFLHGGETMASKSLTLKGSCCRLQYYTILMYETSLSLTRLNALLYAFAQDKTGPMVLLQ